MYSKENFSFGYKLDNKTLDIPKESSELSKKPNIYLAHISYSLLLYLYLVLLFKWKFN